MSFIMLQYGHSLTFHISAVDCDIVLSRYSFLYLQSFCLYEGKEFRKSLTAILQKYTHYSLQPSYSACILLVNHGRISLSPHQCRLIFQICASLCYLIIILSSKLKLHGNRKMVLSSQRNKGMRKLTEHIVACACLIQFNLLTL